MKNKEFINICYKFLNRFIIVDKLIEQLDNMDKKNLQKKEISNINEIINNIKEISNKYPNVHIIKWEESSKDHPEYFYADGIHLKEKGQAAYANAIYDTIYNNYFHFYIFFSNYL